MLSPFLCICSSHWLYDFIFLFPLICGQLHSFLLYLLLLFQERLVRHWHSYVQLLHVIAACNKCLAGVIEWATNSSTLPF